MYSYSFNILREYNSELGVIISTEIFSRKETLEESLFTPYYFYLIFYFGHLFFILIYRLQL